MFGSSKKRTFVPEKANKKQKKLRTKYGKKKHNLLLETIKIEAERGRERERERNNNYESNR